LVLVVGYVGVVVTVGLVGRKDWWYSVVVVIVVGKGMWWWDDEEGGGFPGYGLW